MTLSSDAPRIRKADLDPDPFRQLALWLDAARNAGEREPTAMTLATVGEDGDPDARVVLLKGVEAAAGAGAVTFFTNYESPKAHQLSAHPAAALVLFWSTLARQVRIRGAVERVERAASEAYFASRPRGSQIGAWASPQSRELANAEALEERFAAAERRFAGSEVPCPPHWGGYRLAPRVFEFWQGRESRLHDRFRYLPEGDGRWRIARLSP